MLPPNNNEVTKYKSPDLDYQTIGPRLSNEIVDRLDHLPN